MSTYSVSPTAVCALPTSAMATGPTLGQCVPLVVWPMGTSPANTGKCSRAMPRPVMRRPMRARVGAPALLGLCYNSPNADFVNDVGYCGLVSRQAVDGQRSQAIAFDLQ